MEGAQPWAHLQLQVRLWICVSLGTGSPKPPSRQVPSCPAMEAAGMWAAHLHGRDREHRPPGLSGSGCTPAGAHDNMPGTAAHPANVGRMPSKCPRGPGNNRKGMAKWEAAEKWTAQVRLKAEPLLSWTSSCHMGIQARVRGPK